MKQYATGEWELKSSYREQDSQMTWLPTSLLNCARFKAGVCPVSSWPSLFVVQHQKPWVFFLGRFHQSYGGLSSLSCLVFVSRIFLLRRIFLALSYGPLVCWFNKFSLAYLCIPHSKLVSTFWAFRFLHFEFFGRQRIVLFLRSTYFSVTSVPLQFSIFCSGTRSASFFTVSSVLTVLISLIWRACFRGRKQSPQHRGCGSVERCRGSRA